MLHIEAGSGFAARSVRNDTHGECMFISKLKKCFNVLTVVVCTLRAQDESF